MSEDENLTADLQSTRNPRKDLITAHLWMDPATDWLTSVAFWLMQAVPVPYVVRTWDPGIELEISMRVYGPWSAKEALGAAQIHNPLG